MRRIQQSEVVTAAQEHSIAGQYMVEESAECKVQSAECGVEGSAEGKVQSAECKVSRLRSFEAAAQYRGLHVGVLNFASATNPGGGVTRGSSAQEECLCRCSTLYNCLNTRRIWDAFYMPHRRSGNPLHNDDIIFTPAVQVIKDDDYHLLSAPFAVDVITCAAPNLRERPSNAFNPSENEAVQISPEQLLRLHEQRARKIFSVAVKEHIEVLILGAFGCGAFMNDPAVVAEAYRRVLPEFLPYFRTIEFAIYCRPGDDSNYRAFVSSLNK